MVVKSATKKKLIDSGISEAHAHRLADDRKLSVVRNLDEGDVLGIIYGRTEGTIDEWWVVNDIIARIRKSDNIVQPIDLGIVNHGMILTHTVQAQDTKGWTEGDYLRNLYSKWREEE